jgi:hypothetical protein
LNSGNCLTYRSPEVLVQKCEALNPEQYASMQAAGQAWIRLQSTSVRARELLEGLGWSNWVADTI